VVQVEVVDQVDEGDGVVVEPVEEVEPVEDGGVVIQLVHAELSAALIAFAIAILDAQDTELTT